MELLVDKLFVRQELLVCALSCASAAHFHRALRKCVCSCTSRHAYQMRQLVDQSPLRCQTENLSTASDYHVQSDRRFSMVQAAGWLSRRLSRDALRLELLTIARHQVSNHHLSSEVPPPFCVPHAPQRLPFESRGDLALLGTQSLPQMQVGSSRPVAQFAGCGVPAHPGGNP